jgi:hypothetical protein
VKRFRACLVKIMVKIPVKILVKIPVSGTVSGVSARHASSRGGR